MSDLHKIKTMILGSNFLFLFLNCQKTSVGVFINRLVNVQLFKSERGNIFSTYTFTYTFSIYTWKVHIELPHIFTNSET